MNETVTVEEAIKRGNRMVNYPVMLIMAGVVGLIFFFSNQFKLPTWAIWVAILAFLVLPWLFWSFMITRWRIWAFENVRNVHQLKKRAIEAKLIWEDGSFWEKTEIRTSADRNKIQLLEGKFNHKDVFVDDYTIPDETIVTYSSVKSYGALFLGLVFVAVCIYLYMEKSYFISVMGLLTACYLCFVGIKNAANKKPQIIISNKGIQTYRTPFYQWSDIQQEGVKRERSGKSGAFYFVYHYTGGNEKLDIAEYNMGKGELSHLLHVYRGRNEKNYETSGQSIVL